MTAGRALAVAGLSLVALALGGVLAIASAWAGASGLGVAVAAVVIAVGAALVVSSFAGGARWLVVPALLLAAPLGVVAATGFELNGGYGERHYRPTTASAIPADGYELAVGRLVVDLRDLDWSPGRVVDVELDVGIGEAEVLVPDDVCVEPDAHIGAGRIDVRDADMGGIDVDLESGSPDATRAARLRLDADVSFGVLSVDDESFDGPRRHFGRDRDDDAEDVAAAACGEA